MEKEKYLRLWGAVSSDIDQMQEYSKRKPILAHYSSIQVVESILRNEEIWLSNPLNMNDIQELRSGLQFAIEELMKSEPLKTALGPDLYKSFVNRFEGWLLSYGENEILDLYVACFSEHRLATHAEDGILAMWRGYADDAKGAALVFDTGKFPVGKSNALILEPVYYGNDYERKEHIATRISELVRFINHEGLKEDEISAASYCFFQRMYLFSIFTKHSGFSDEKEWRLVYIKEHDTSEAFHKMLSWSFGANGVEPKLKLKVQSDPDLFEGNVRMEDLIHTILIGPRSSSPLNLHSATRMLDSISSSGLSSKLRASSIPYRG